VGEKGEGEREREGERGREREREIEREGERERERERGPSCHGLSDPPAHLPCSPLSLFCNQPSVTLLSRAPSPSPCSPLSPPAHAAYHSLLLRRKSDGVLAACAPGLGSGGGSIAKPLVLGCWREWRETPLLSSRPRGGGGCGFPFGRRFGRVQGAFQALLELEQLLRHGVAHEDREVACEVAERDLALVYQAAVHGHAGLWAHHRDADARGLDLGNQHALGNVEAERGPLLLAARELTKILKS